MPHKFYRARTCRVWNVTKRSIGDELNKQNHKEENSCPSHHGAMRKSCRKNDQLKTEAKAQGKIISTKRQPEWPEPGFTVEGATVETVTPIPYDVVNDLKGGC